MRGNADRTKPAARGDGRSGRQLHQSLDFSHAIVDPFGEYLGWKSVTAIVKGVIGVSDVPLGFIR